MPHLKSAKKRLRQSKLRRQRNRAVSSDLKTEIKKYLKAVKDKKIDEAKTHLVECYSRLDKAGARRYLHPNKASRMKARLAAKLGHLEKPST